MRLAQQSQEIQRLELSTRVYERALLDDVGRAVLDDGPLPSTGIYMIVDRRCAACDAALETFRRNGARAEIHLASFGDRPDVLRSWASDLQLAFSVVDVPLESTFLSRLPRTVTPLYLEFEDGQPVSLHIGQPRENWLLRRE